MGTIMGLFQILWVYYGLLIASRPVIIWNVIAVLVNFLNVGGTFISPAKKKPNRRGSLGVDGGEVAQNSKREHGPRTGSSISFGRSSANTEN
jgi:hypothetical protein